MMLANPAAKYRPFQPINLSDRQWPGRVVLLNDEAAERVVSGVFALDRPDAVFDALERGLGVRATRITPYLTLLR